MLSHIGKITKFLWVSVSPYLKQDNHSTYLSQLCQAHPLSISSFRYSYLQKIHEIHFTSSVISCPICFPCVQDPEQVHHFEEELFGHGGKETPPHVKCALRIGLMHLSTSSQSAGNFFVSRKAISARQPSKHMSANFDPS